jgi:hypothetical protein
MSINKFKIISFFILYSIICHNASSSEEEFNKSILHRSRIYKYSNDQSEETEIFFPSNQLTSEKFMEELNKIKPIHVNLIDMEVSDSVLLQLIPYSNFIHGLSLSDNFFTNKSLDYLTKFSELRYLNLSNNRFIFPSLDCLSDMNHLNHLDITYNRISYSELLSIQEKMKNVKIIFS